MGLGITTLSENTSGMDGFLGEWGLSILVESEEALILFDTGQSVSTVHNANLLGVCHCTGLAASAIMAQEFGDRFFFNNAGTVLNL